MTTAKESAFKALIQKLDRLAGLNDTDKQMITDLPFRSMTVPANTQLVREGDKVTECCLLLSGYAFRYKVAANGNRQIVSFHLAGDVIGLR
jgi:CRP-like cAMP-binding protein